MIEPVVKQLLSTLPEIIERCPSNRIYPVHATENAPITKIVFAASLTDSEWATAGPIGLYYYTLEVEAYANDFDDVLAIMQAIRGLDGYKGEIIRQMRLMNAEPVGTEANEGFAYSASFNMLATM